MEIVIASVMAFLTGTFIGIMGMYFADSKYIRIIQNSCKRIEKICKYDVEVLKKANSQMQEDNDRLYQLVNDLQIRIAEIVEGRFEA